jgi:hypothetical protein
VQELLCSKLLFQRRIPGIKIYYRQALPLEPGDYHFLRPSQLVIIPWDERLCLTSVLKRSGDTIQAWGNDRKGPPSPCNFLPYVCKMSTHPLLTAFRANKPAFGAWLSAAGIFHARTVAQASPHISWIIIDCEHGLIPLVPGAAESVTAIRGAVQGGGPSAIVRIPATGVSSSTSWQIKYALDAGASGILVPLVGGFPCYSNASTADEAVGLYRRESQGDRRRLSFPSNWAPWIR